MFSEYFNNFNMFKHNNVKLVFDNQELLPSIVDFDFTITNKLNSKLSASISVYNLTIDKLGSLKIVCNNAIFFTAKGKEDITDLTSRTNESTTTYTINANVSPVKLPNIIEKGYVVKNNGNDLLLPNNKPLITTKDYIFSNKDDEQAKLSVILQGEGYGGFAVNQDKLSVVVKETDVEKLKSINPHSLLILSVVENFAGEELTIISLFSPFLMAGKNINYKSNASKVERNYTITGVTTDWNCKTGLIQTTTAVTGSRLTYFNDHQKKQTTTGESED